MRNLNQPNVSDPTGAALTTIVITRDRVALLARALRSLMAQQAVRLDVIIVVDACSATVRWAQTLPVCSGAIRSIQWLYQDRGISDHTGPRRLATLRTLGLAAVQTEWCGYLDDDNEFEPSHYHDILNSIANSGSRAAHSWRTLWERDGRPFFLTDTHPWCRDPSLAAALFEQYRRAGIYDTASNLVRDRVVPGRRSESMVDMSEWLFDTDFIRQIGFATKYTGEDWQTSRAEDSKLLDEIVARHLDIPSTRRATLRYYMGGYSNNWLSDGAQLCGWT